MAIILPAGLTASPPGARAAQDIVLASDQFQMVKLPEAPATVIVGNPTVANVTTDGASLFLYPRGYGTTTVLALDGTGAKLADYEVSVVYEEKNSIAMYTPEGRRTYTCRKDCERTLRIGDDPAHTGAYTNAVTGKKSFIMQEALGGTPIARTGTPSAANGLVE